MANIIIAAPDWSDSATIVTTGNEDAAAPAANLQTLQPTHAYQSVDLTGLVLELDRGAAEPFNLVALLFANITAAGTWRVRAADTKANLTAGPGYDSGTIGFWASPGLDQWTRTHSLLWIPAGVTERWLRIDIADGANPDGYINAGRLYVSNAFQPTEGFNWGKPISLVPAEQLRAKPGEPPIANTGDNVPVADFTLSWLTEAEAEAGVDRLERFHQGRKDVLVCFNPDPASSRRSQDMIYGILSPTPSKRRAVGIWEKKFKITGRP